MVLLIQHHIVQNYLIFLYLGLDINCSYFKLSDIILLKSSAVIFSVLVLKSLDFYSNILFNLTEKEKSNFPFEFSCSMLKGIKFEFSSCSFLSFYILLFF